MHYLIHSKWQPLAILQTITSANDYSTQRRSTNWTVRHEIGINWLVIIRVYYQNVCIILSASVMCASSLCLLSDCLFLKCHWKICKDYIIFYIPESNGSNFKYKFDNHLNITYVLDMLSTHYRNMHSFPFRITYVNCLVNVFHLILANNTLTMLLVMMLKQKTTEVTNQYWNPWYL